MKIKAERIEKSTNMTPQIVGRRVIKELNASKYLVNATYLQYITKIQCFHCQQVKTFIMADCAFPGAHRSVHVLPGRLIFISNISVSKSTCDWEYLCMNDCKIPTR